MAADLALLGDWIENLRLDELEPGDPRYVALPESSRGAVDSIYTTISLARARPTAQLLSGPRGSGKTTELLRLRQRLEDDGYTAVVIDMLAYVSQSAPLQAVDFLVAFGLAVGERLGPDAEDGFPSRFRRFLERINVSFDVGPASVKASADGVGVSVPGLSVDIDLKRELRSSKTFVEGLRERLAYQVGQLHDEVATFSQEQVAAALDRHPGSRGVVIIVDSLEKLRDGPSVRDLFVIDSDKLKFGSHHVVYTVPPVLQFNAPGTLPFDGPVRFVPVPHVRSPGGAPFEDGIARLTEVVRRRVDVDLLFGDDAALRTVVLASGGHLRDLLRLVQEVVSSAFGRSADLPVDASLIDNAITEVARGFASITTENAACLRQVHAANGKVELDDDEVDRLAELLDTHMLLGHQNGEPWYEVHPLARRSLGLE